MSIDWQQVIGSILIGGSGLGGVIWAAIVGWKKFSPAINRPGVTVIPPGRSADDLPPEGAVEWVADIRRRMGSASADTVLDALTKGFTGAQAQELRITELEGKP